MIIWSLILIGLALFFYVVVGSVLDAWQDRRRTQEARAMEVLSRALYADHEQLEPLLEEMRSISSQVLLSIAMHVPLHFDDQLSHRLLDVVGNTTARRKVSRLSKSRFWPRRVRAARMVQILPDSEATTRRLLSDPNAAVRAATIESFDTDQIARFAGELFESLDDKSQAVRFVSQQALLRGDGRLVRPVSKHLPTLSEDLITRGLEVAAHLGDPRLLSVIEPHATSDDPRVRRLVAAATPFGIPEEYLGFFVELLADDDPSVRVAGIDAVARTQAQWLAGRVGVGLRDRSYEVRRASGDCLAQLGAVGLLVLRAALTCDDPFAHDMAQQVIDGLVVDGRVAARELVEDGENLDSLTAWGAAA